MKHIITLFCLTLLVIVPTFAQSNGKEKKEHLRIEEIVSDLSASQKRQLNNIYEEDKARLDALRSKQQAVRDSIHYYLSMDGNYSQQLFPLFEREAQLQAAISREMYSTRIRINEVLTPDQRALVHKTFADRKKREKNKKK